MDLIGSEIKVHGVPGHVIQYFEDVGRVLIKTLQGAHLLALPSDCQFLTNAASASELESEDLEDDGGKRLPPVSLPHLPRPHPDYNWYREGFVRTGDVSERCAKAILSWIADASRGAADRTGIFSCTVLGGDELDILLPQPPQLTSWAVTRGVTPSAREQHLSVRLSLASHPAARKGVGPVQENSRRADAVHVPTFVNPLTCRRVLIYESGPARTGRHCDFAFPQLCVGLIQPPVLLSTTPGSSRRSSPRRSAVETGFAASLIADPAALLLASYTPGIDWQCLESYLLFQVIATSAHSGGYASPQQAQTHTRVVGHAVMRVCDILAGAVRQYSSLQSHLHTTIHAVAAALNSAEESGDAKTNSPPMAAGRKSALPLEFFARLRLPIVPLMHSAASKRLGARAPFASLDVELSLVLPPGLQLPEEFLQASLAPPPAVEVPLSQRLIPQAQAPSPPSSHGRPSSAARHVPGPARASADVMTTPARRAIPQQSSTLQSTGGGGFRLGSRWSLGPGKEAQEERLARTLAAYSNVRGGGSSLQSNAHGSSGNIGARPSISPTYTAEGQALHDDTVAAEAVTRTAMLIRANVADLRHSIEDIEVQLQAQTRQMQGLSNGAVTSVHINEGGDSDAGGQATESSTSGRGPQTMNSAASEHIMRPTAGLQQQAIRLHEELSHVMLALQQQQSPSSTPAVHLVPRVRPRSAASRHSTSTTKHRRPHSASLARTGW